MDKNPVIAEENERTSVGIRGETKARGHFARTSRLRYAPVMAVVSRTSYRGLFDFFFPAASIAPSVKKAGWPHRMSNQPSC